MTRCCLDDTVRTRTGSWKRATWVDSLREVRGLAELLRQVVLRLDGDDGRSSGHLETAIVHKLHSEVHQPGNFNGKNILVSLDNHWVIDWGIWTIGLEYINIDFGQVC